MINELKRKDLEKQGYRLVGHHSAIKVCGWTKKSLLGKGECYKNTFYGIKTWQCVQMTPALPVCTHRCLFCWRDTSFTQTELDQSKLDSPELIVKDCAAEHIKYIQGFKGHPGVDMKKFKEAENPKHFAISLAGEMCMYPRLGELIDEIHKQEYSSFLVTNGTFPEKLNELTNHQPTQLYITVPAPNKEVYLKTCNPTVSDGWEKIKKSLKILGKFNRKTIRLTLAKGLNLVDATGYAQLLKDIDFDFLEFKAYMWVGHSQKRMKIDDMASHAEIKAFAQEVCDLTGWKIIDEAARSRCVLVVKKDREDRKMKFD